MIYFNMIPKRWDFRIIKLFTARSSSSNIVRLCDQFAPLLNKLDILSRRHGGIVVSVPCLPGVQSSWVDSSSVMQLADISGQIGYWHTAGVDCTLNATVKQGSRLEFGQYVHWQWVVGHYIHDRWGSDLRRKQTIPVLQRSPWNPNWTWSYLLECDGDNAAFTKTDHIWPRLMQ